MTYNPRTNKRENLIKQFGLIELHGRDGSAINAGCACIEDKHLFNIEALSEESVGYALTMGEKEFYLWVADLARNIRKKIDVGDWTIPCNPVPGSKCSPVRVKHAAH